MIFQNYQAPPLHQIPCFYLLDSILKNVGGVYRQEFAKNIAETFRHSYNVCLDEDKLRLKKMLETWRDYLGLPIFSQRTIENCREVVRLAVMTPPFDRRLVIHILNWCNYNNRYQTHFQCQTVAMYLS